MVLSKWYLDVVASDGRAMIGYLSEVRIGPLYIGPGAVLLRDVDGQVRQRTILRGAGCVEFSEDRVSWSCPRFRISGTWDRCAASIERTLLAREDGFVRWSCMQPSSSVLIKHDGRVWKGEGYVERLTVTVPLGRLPIERLRWGRFVGERTSIVWIEWQGSEPRLLVFRNGVQESSAVVNDDRIGLSDIGDSEGDALLLDRGITLRDGIIGRRALRGLCVLKPILPRSLRQGYETKWLSRGVLRSSRGEIDHGWAIHEFTRFGAARR